MPTTTTPVGREIDPLLPSSQTNAGALDRSKLDNAALSIRGVSGETFDNVPQTRRRLGENPATILYPLSRLPGLYSVISLIFNRVIGTGIYATPSLILRNAGSVGVALLMWLIGALIAALGTTVYIELGTGLPRNGGEKNYLEYIYRRPRFLMSSIYICYALLTGSSAANSIVFGEYVLHALALTPTAFNIRFVAFLGLTFTMVVHGVFLKFGIRLLNALAIFKLAILGLIAGSGIMYMLCVPGFTLQPGCEKSRNFEWGCLWEGSSTGANALIATLYNVIWSFVGYDNANYALSEIRDPVRTIKHGAALAMLAVTSVYIFINIAVFGVVSKADLLASRQIAAALFFRNLFGSTTERALSGLIALSTLGNILANQFTQGRVVQELGREGVLPYSAFFATSKPFNAPLSGMVTQYIISMLLVVAPPSGDAYQVLINIKAYSLSVINTLVSVGLCLLHTPPYSGWDWNPPFRAPKPVVFLFVLSNIFLVIVPLVPPVHGSVSRVYISLPYWFHVAVSWSLSVIGVLYWSVWCVWLPKRKGYRLERKCVLQDDGMSKLEGAKMTDSLQQCIPYLVSFILNEQIFPWDPNYEGYITNAAKWCALANKGEMVAARTLAMINGIIPIGRGHLSSTLRNPDQKTCASFLFPNNNYRPRSSRHENRRF